MKKLFLTCTFSLLALVSSSFAQREAAALDRYGVIEIGGSGIKALAIEKLRDAGRGSEDPPTRTLQEYKIENSNAYKADGEGIAKKVGTEVATFIRSMQADHSVPRNHIYVVGSSGIPDDVRQAIGNNLEGTTIEFIGVETETRLVFKGIVPPWRLNLNEVVLLDIGSGNSKGTYLARDRNYVSFSIPLGAKTLGSKMAKDPTQSETILANEVVTPIQADRQKFPGMHDCTRLYLAGGITWAMTMFQYPEKFGRDEQGNESNWVSIQNADVRRFCDRAIADPSSLFNVDYSKVRMENLEDVKKDVRRIRSIFSLNSKDVQKEVEPLTKELKTVEDEIKALEVKKSELQAKIADIEVKKLDLAAIKPGAMILRAYTDAMDYETTKRAIRFSKRALYAWPHGYILEKLSAAAPAATAAPTAPAAPIVPAKKSKSSKKKQ